MNRKEQLPGTVAARSKARNVVVQTLGSCVKWLHLLGNAMFVSTLSCRELKTISSTDGFPLNLRTLRSFAASYNQMLTEPLQTVGKNNTKFDGAVVRYCHRKG
jgi:hypothetical protein